MGILVANPKGGVGKTPVALLLGGMLAAVRAAFAGSLAWMSIAWASATVTSGRANREHEER